MKLYKTKDTIIIDDNHYYYELESQNWDSFINDDKLYEKLSRLTQSIPPKNILPMSDLLAPIGQQELWGCGITYYWSMVGRQEESRDAGGGDFYAKVYNAERPEVFFKSTAHRIKGPNDAIRIRKDSTWDLPEPELTLVVTSSGKIVGYTIGNDMSSRSIEGENPLYLPQAKTYDGCASVGPCIFVTDKPLDPATTIYLSIRRNSSVVFNGSIAISKMKSTLQELVSFVYRECSFPHGCLLMTGTGIVPPNDFTLQKGDEIIIEINDIGELVNTVG